MSLVKTKREYIIAALQKIIRAAHTNLNDKIKYFESFLPDPEDEFAEYDDSLSQEQPANIYDRIKKALMLEFLWHRVDELQRKKINYQYKKLDIVEILAYLYVVLYHGMYMLKGKGSDIIEVINKIKRSHDFLSEIHALTIALNSVHHYGKIIPDYIGILSDAELDELSNISEEEIKKYAKEIKVPLS